MRRSHADAFNLFHPLFLDIFRISIKNARLPIRWASSARRLELRSFSNRPPTQLPPVLPGRVRFLTVSRGVADVIFARTDNFGKRLRSASITSDVSSTDSVVGS